jgi:hypothetical protein
MIFRLDEHRDAGDAFRSRVDAFAAVLDGVPDGVVILDGSRFVSWANPAMGVDLRDYKLQGLGDAAVADPLAAL